MSLFKKYFEAQRKNFKWDGWYKTVGGVYVKFSDNKLISVYNSNNSRYATMAEFKRFRDEDLKFIKPNLSKVTNKKDIDELNKLDARKNLNG